MAKRPLEVPQDWIGEDPLSRLEQPDILGAICGRARADRQGRTYEQPTADDNAYESWAPRTPLPHPSSSPSELQSPTAFASHTASESPTEVSLLNLLFDANHELDGGPLKILIAAMELGSDLPISLTRFSDVTGQSKGTVLRGIRICLDWGWLTRQQSCPRCKTALPETDGDKVVPCPGCRRPVPPDARYTVQFQNRAVQELDSPASLQHRSVQNMHSPGHIPHSLPVQKSNSRPVQIPDRADQLHDRPHAQAPVQNLHTPVQDQHSPTPNPDSRILEESNKRNVSESPDARLAAETGTNSVSNFSGKDNRIEEWRKTTEDLARHSVQELGDSNSLGYHIQVWNHARKHDRSFPVKDYLTNGVFDILRELSQRRQSNGKPQGPAFTRRTQKSFAENGVPLGKGNGSEAFDPDELAEVRKAIKEAPFMQGAGEPLSGGPSR